jgi:hypothetical protein
LDSSLVVAWLVAWTGEALVEPLELCFGFFFDARQGIWGFSDIDKVLLLESEKVSVTGDEDLVSLSLEVLDALDVSFEDETDESVDAVSEEVVADVVSESVVVVDPEVVLLEEETAGMATRGVTIGGVTRIVSAEGSVVVVVEDEEVASVTDGASGCVTWSATCSAIVSAVSSLDMILILFFILVKLYIK